MESESCSLIEVKNLTVICDSEIINNGNGVNQNSKNVNGRHLFNGVENDLKTGTNELTALKCIAENGDGLHQTKLSAPATTLPIAATAQISTASANANGCMSWYARCKWRSQSCDRKQKFCPRPRYSWINGNNNNSNSNNINNNGET